MLRIRFLLIGGGGVVGVGGSSMLSGLSRHDRSCFRILVVATVIDIAAVAIVAACRSCEKLHHCWYCGEERLMRSWDQI